MPNLKAIAQLLSKIRWGGYFAPPPVKLWTYRYPGKTRVKRKPTGGAHCAPPSTNRVKRAYGEVEDNIIIYIETLKT